MIVGAHVAGIPVEELLPSLTGLLAARAWMMFHVRRRRKPDE
jgi:hypothetical protein